jgi:hypothetical protein
MVENRLDRGRSLFRGQVHGPHDRIGVGRARCARAHSTPTADPAILPNEAMTAATAMIEPPAGAPPIDSDDLAAVVVAVDDALDAATDERRVVLGRARRALIVQSAR